MSDFHMSEFDKLLEALKKKYIAEGMSEFDAVIKAVLSDEALAMVYPNGYDKEDVGSELRKVWANNVAPHLVGRKIIGVEWQSNEEKESFGFHNSAVKILVENGKDGDPIVLTAMRDDEGNDAGAIATNIVGIEILPVI